MPKSEKPDTSVDDDAEMGYDPSLIKVHDTPPYSTDHVEHGRPHLDDGNQDYDPNSLDILSELEPSTFERGDNIAEGPQPIESEDPADP
jgi:hypothetical protein